MAGRLAGKRVIVTDCNEYAGADIVKLFREEDGEVFAVDGDLTIPSAADDLIREAGHVDILIANFAYPHKYAPAHKKSDEDMEYTMQRLFSPLHRLTRARLAADAGAEAWQDCRRGQRRQSARSKRRRGPLRWRTRRPARLYETCRDGSGAPRQRQCDGAVLCRKSHL
jgi:NAD(P)-dependent dehydrogenase (short-subunit alcohol dehydrogenase family)